MLGRPDKDVLAQYMGSLAQRPNLPHLEMVELFKALEAGIKYVQDHVSSADLERFHVLPHAVDPNRIVVAGNTATALGAQAGTFSGAVAAGTDPFDVLATSLTITILLGWMLILTGSIGLALTFWARQLPGFWWSLLSAIVALFAGVVLLAWPIQGTVTLTSSSPAEFGSFIAGEIIRLGRSAKLSGATAD